MGNCPSTYYDNCCNNQLCPACSVCGGDDLLYSPIVDIGPHPYIPSTTVKVSPKRKRDGRRAQRAGYIAERDIFTLLGGTHNPTSIGYDGTIDGYRVEYKVRLPGTSNPSPIPTRAEWNKACEQGNRLLIVEDKSTGSITVTMSIDTFRGIRHETGNDPSRDRTPPP